MHLFYETYNNSRVPHKTRVALQDRLNVSVKVEVSMINVLECFVC